MAVRILLIDDDRDATESLWAILVQEGYEVDHAPIGRIALRLVLVNKPDLVILGIRPGVQNGQWRFCRLLLNFLESPLLLLLSGGNEIDRIRGLELGADDCMIRPVLMPELAARVRALLRRSAARYAQSRTSLYVDGDLVVDLTRGEARLDDQLVDLTPTEFRILACLIREVGCVLSRERLRLQVWGTLSGAGTGNIKQHIHNLRRKLEEDPAHPRRILTRWGEGYLLQRIAVE